MKLLIAEDEQDLAEALSAFFTRSRFSVDVVHDGADAYAYAATGAYDAVILDIMMPKLDGIQVLKKLRGDGVKTPIMMLTAKGQTMTALPASMPEPTTIFPSPLIRTSF